MGTVAGTCSSGFERPRQEDHVSPGVRKQLRLQSKNSCRIFVYTIKMYLCLRHFLIALIKY